MGDATVVWGCLIAVICLTISLYNYVIKNDMLKATFHMVVAFDVLIILHIETAVKRIAG